MRETRLKIAKTEYARGNYDHKYVKEFWEELSAPPPEPAPPKPKKKKHWRKMR